MNEAENTSTAPGGRDEILNGRCPGADAKLIGDVVGMGALSAAIGPHGTQKPPPVARTAGDLVVKIFPDAAPATVNGSGSTSSGAAPRSARTRGANE